MEFLELIFEGLVAFYAVSIFANLMYYGLLIAMYVLSSLGLYTIAKRRQISNPWMAWVPGLNYWILGSISDQYQYVVKGKISNLRKWLVVLLILVLVLAILTVAFTITFCVQAFLYENAEPFTGAPIGKMPEEAIVPLLVVAPLYLILVMVMNVLVYVAYFRLFASCDPENKWLFLVLSLFMNFLLPIFVFICRKKDLGMPPRADAAFPGAVYQPNPVYQAPVEPWTLPPEQEL